MKINIDYYTNYTDKMMKQQYEEFVNNYREKINKLVCTAIDMKQLKIENVYLGIGVVTKDEIQKINKEYRKIDKVTDVLSFPIYSTQEINDMKEKEMPEEISIGDVVLCMDVIIEHSKQYETGFEREMLYMIVHGMCHLLGYDHENEEDKRVMRKVEEEILEGVRS